MRKILLAFIRARHSHFHNRAYLSLIILAAMGVAMLVPPLAFAAPQDYAIACSAPCNVQNPDGTISQQPSGYIVDTILIDAAASRGWQASWSGDGVTPVVMFLNQSGLGIGSIAPQSDLAKGVSQLP